MHPLPRAAAALLGLLAVAPARAAVITDPAGDFIGTFLGTRSGNLDVLSFSATYDGSTFHFGATLNGPVNNPPTSLYVIGVDRGRGAAPFTAIGLPNVTFDAVVTLTGAGVLGGVAAGLPSGAARISGNSFVIDVPGTLLPSTGRDPSNYLVNLWPRDGTLTGNPAIADFAPDATTVAVPEPASILAVATGLFALTMRRRDRRG